MDTRDGRLIRGKDFFEVGTGYNPIVPIDFFLCGAKKVITVDLHRKLDIGILKKSLLWMAENWDTFVQYYYKLTASEAFDKRMNLIDSLKDRPEKLLSGPTYWYLAPADVSNTDLPDDSVDYHVSTTVFEHIPNKNIVRILTEAKRILKNNREAVHFIDLSDHFQHQGERITRINFLRYSERECEKIAGNQFNYCNSLGLSDYLALCKESGFDVCYYKTQEDYEAVQSLKDGFPVDELSSDYSVNGLRATQHRAVLKAKVKEGRYI